MKKTISLVFILSWALNAEVVNADFIFGTPVTKVPNVNSSSAESGAVTSPDGLELYFLSNRPHGVEMDYCDIWVATRETTDYEWGMPVILSSPVNSSAWESDPSLSANGLELYFGDGAPPAWSGFMHRPGGHGGGDIWVSVRTTKNDPWGEPKNLGPIINTSAFEGDPVLSADSLELYFGSDRRTSGDVELYVSTRATASDPWGEPVRLGSTINPSNSPWWDSDPEISPDGLTLFFSSWRPSGHGEGDLYVTTRAARDDDWGPAANLGPSINSAYSDADPSLSADGSVLYFSRGQNSDRSSWDLWQVPIISIFKAHNPTPSDGAILRDTWLNLSWSPGHTAGNSRDVYLGENPDDVAAGIGDTFQGNQAEMSFIIGFPGFPYPDGLVPGTTYYWRIDEVEAGGTVHKGKVWSFRVAPKTAYFPDPADGGESVDLNGTLSWIAGFDAMLHYVYFGDNFDDVTNAAGGLPQGTTDFTPGTLKMANTYYWRVDEFDAIETPKGDVWSFTTEGAVETLDPVNGAVNVTQTPVLTWTHGVFSASHEIYFGIKKDAVKNADTSSPEYKGSGNLGSENFDPGQLEWNTTYYWRIDEINNTNTDSPWTGPLWSFTTANFLIIDDFESYNDLNEDEPGSNRIYLAWADGLDNPVINGSVVGHVNPPFAERTIVHGGNQSMPMSYDNAVGKSEATLTLTSNRDWTVNGVNRLTIWFRGDMANAAENLYVALNDNAVVNHDNPNAALITSWIAWNIDLQAFADQGINLANVNSITLGLGNRSNPVAGGTGMMYFDDIRLYRPVQ